MGIADRKRESSNLSNFSSRFQLEYRFSLNFPNISTWTWENSVGSSISYLDGVFCRPTDRNSIGCPQVEFVNYTDHKFVFCTVDLNRFHMQGA